MGPLPVWPGVFGITLVAGCCTFPMSSSTLYGKRKSGEKSKDNLIFASQVLQYWNTFFSFLNNNGLSFISQLQKFLNYSGESVVGSIVAVLLPCLELNCACGFQGCGLSSSLVFTSSKLQLQITFVKVGATFTMLIF